MIDLIAIDSDITRLRAALSAKDETMTDRGVAAIEKNLLGNESFRQIGDERLLANALQLLSQQYGEELQSRLASLREHLKLMRLIHDKLYAILNARIELEVLLFEYLDNWSPILAEPIGCSFSAEAKNMLAKARNAISSNDQLEEFLLAYYQQLNDQGLGHIVNIVEKPVMLALEGYKRNLSWASTGLFATAGKGEISGLRIAIVANGDGSIGNINDIDTSMKSVARGAMAYAKRILPQMRMYDITWGIERSDIPYQGPSVGLPLVIGIFSKVEGFDIDAYTAFTGDLDWESGAIKSVEYLPLKLQAAKELGIRRVFIPRDTTDDVSAFKGIEILRVASVQETKQHLLDKNYGYTNTPLEKIAQARIRELEINLRSKNVHLVSINQREGQCKRAIFSNYREEIPVDIFYANRLVHQVGGSASNLKQIVKDECDQVFGKKPAPSQQSPGQNNNQRTNYKITAPQTQQKIEKYLFDRSDSIREQIQNCVYRAKIVKSGLTAYVFQFTSGTLTIDAPPILFQEINGHIRMILELPSLELEPPKNDVAHVNAQVVAILSIELGEQWIGTDEAGKGDYFGPLVGAAVLVDNQTAKLLTELGVKDSKSLSDKRNQELATRIQQVCGKKAQVVTIPPERYNTLYAQFQKEGKNLNTLLAWAHTRAIEDILTEYPQQKITVVVDKFADEHYIQSKLLEKGRSTALNLVQLPKAEANIAVAAASILARAQFLNWLDRLSKQYQINLPKGSSDPRVTQVGKQIVAQLGQDELRKVAKFHFATTKSILPLPE